MYLLLVKGWYLSLIIQFEQSHISFNKACNKTSSHRDGRQFLKNLIEKYGKLTGIFLYCVIQYQKDTFFSKETLFIKCI